MSQSRFPSTPAPPVPTPLPAIEVRAGGGTGAPEPAQRYLQAELVTEAAVTRARAGRDSPTEPAGSVARLGGRGRAGELHAEADAHGRPRWIAGLGSASPADCRAAGAALARAADSAGAPNGAPDGASAGSDRGLEVRWPWARGRTERGQTKRDPETWPEPAAFEHFCYGLLLGGYRYRITGTPAAAATTEAPADDPHGEQPVLRVVIDGAEPTEGAGDGAEPTEGVIDGAEPTEGAGDGAGFAARAERARTLAAATALARDLANTPANIKNPAWLAETASRLSAEHRRLRATVHDERWLAEQGFGGILAVGAGSASPPRLIEMHYEPQRAEAELLLVGKGVIFDTGGISIKPADGMHLMRTDMAGAAAVFAAMRAISELGAPVRVTAMLPCAENHVSGAAYRPGDVITHYGGRTTAVSNTDAEGRIVLADALVYGIEQYRPDAVLDVATLTGAMKVALGLRTGGVFACGQAPAAGAELAPRAGARGGDRAEPGERAEPGNLAERVCAAGAAAGEAWWPMPLLDAHAHAVRAEVADLAQAPDGPGGVTAALFLREFVGETPWAHLDIAGPARAEEDYAEVVAGATGFGARTLVELIDRWPARPQEARLPPEAARARAARPR